MDWRLATSPTSRSPLLVKATTDGVVRLPSALGMTTGSPPSMTATQLLVVPRSMPMTLGTLTLLSFVRFVCLGCFVACRRRSAERLLRGRGALPVVRAYERLAARPRQTTSDDVRQSRPTTYWMSPPLQCRRWLHRLRWRCRRYRRCRWWLVSRQKTRRLARWACAPVAPALA